MKLSVKLSVPSLASLTLLLTAPAVAAQDVGPVFDSFTGGVNLGDWIYNGTETTPGDGGNPGFWLHQSFASTFAPIFSSQTSVYNGDYRAAGVTRMTFDARLINKTFGDGSGFSMSVLLRDTKGTADVTDDDYAYFVGENVPIQGTGWKSFDFAIPSADTSAVPTGWTGGWVGDCCSFRPGVDWNDVITSVDRAEIWWIDPSFFAIIDSWNIGHDNIALWADGSSVLRNGTGVNPLNYSETSPAAIGGTWDTAVSLGGDIASIVGIGSAPLSGVFPGGIFVGESLIAPPYALVDVATGNHSVPVPLTPSYLGVTLPTQGASVSALGMVTLYNALDITIGA